MPQSPASQLKSFLAKFDPAMAKLIHACRSAMRKRFPTANELVYDNYNFFVIGYCPTEVPSDCRISLAANSKGVHLNFLDGSKLPDPHKLLQGSGSLNRFLRLENAAALNKPEGNALFAAAEAQTHPAFAKSGAGKLIIRSVSKKQRPRK